MRLGQVWEGFSHLDSDPDEGRKNAGGLRALGPGEGLGLACAGTERPRAACLSGAQEVLSSPRGAL